MEFKNFAEALVNEMKRSYEFNETLNDANITKEEEF